MTAATSLTKQQAGKSSIVLNKQPLRPQIMKGSLTSAPRQVLTTTTPSASKPSQQQQPLSPQIQRRIAVLQQNRLGNYHHQQQKQEEQQQPPNYSPQQQSPVRTQKPSLQQRLQPAGPPQGSPSPHPQQQYSGAGRGGPQRGGGAIRGLYIIRYCQ